MENSSAGVRKIWVWAEGTSRDNVVRWSLGGLGLLSLSPLSAMVLARGIREGVCPTYRRSPAASREARRAD